MAGKPALRQSDRDQIARRKADELREQAKAEAFELAPTLLGVLGGLTDEIRALRTTNERMLTDSGERRLVDNQMLEAVRGLTAELAALRMQRANGGNGHASDDNLSDDTPPIVAEP